MPGYDRDRFVDLQESEAEEYTCGICHDVYNRPVVLSCCQQTYCQECIDEWLNGNQTCPNDRRALSRDNLTPAPKMVMNLLNKLKIKCNYHAQGCANVCLLENLQAHLKNECEHNPERKCSDCGSIKSQNEEHNCVRTLLEQINQLKAQILSITEEQSIRRDVQQFDSGANIIFSDQIRDLRRDFHEMDDMFKSTCDSLAESLSLLMTEIAVIKDRIGVE